MSDTAQIKINVLLLSVNQTGFQAGLSAQLASQSLYRTAGTPSSSALLATDLKFKSRLAFMVFTGKKLVLPLLRPKCSFVFP